jgi:DNA polymerase III gamma/tau subunit
VKLEGGQSPVLNVSEHEVRDLMEQASGVSFEDLHRLFQILLNGEALMARAPFPKVILEMTVVEMARLDSLLPVEEILSRVEQLEHTLSQRGLRAERTSSRSRQEDNDRDAQDRQMPVEDVSTSLPESEGREGSELREEALRQWQEFLTFVRGENPVLASFLIQGHPLRLDDACLEIGFTKGSFALDRCSEDDTLHSVEEIARRHFKHELQVKITSTNLSKDAKKTSKISTHDGETDLVRHLKKEAVGNPVIQEAVEIFQGKIIDVKVKEGS